MAYVVRPDSAVRHRFVFELRYERGELYLDRSGRVAHNLAAREGWAMQSVDANGCHIRNEEQNLVFTFSPAKLDLAQSQSQDVSELLSPGEFAAIAEEFCECVVQTLEVDCSPRIGFRLWTLYPTESLEEASSRIGRMSFFAPSDALRHLGELGYVSHSVVIARPRSMVRVAAVPFEQQIQLAPSVIAAARTKAHKQWKDQKAAMIQKMKAKKAIHSYPPVGIMIDLDAYIEEVSYPTEVSARAFILEAMDDFGVICDNVLSEEVQS